MAIDFTDPAQTTHDGETIAINTAAKFAAGQEILKRIYAFVGVPWSTTAADAYEQRVRNGQTLREIINNTYDEYLERSSNTPGTEV